MATSKYGMGGGTSDKYGGAAAMHNDPMYGASSWEEEGFDGAGYVDGGEGGCSCPCAEEEEDHFEIVEAEGEKLELTFTSLNWNLPQTVVLWATPDNIDEDDGHQGVVEHTVSGSDPWFVKLVHDRFENFAINDPEMTLDDRAAPVLTKAWLDPQRCGLRIEFDISTDMAGMLATDKDRACNVLTSDVLALLGPMLCEMLEASHDGEPPVCPCGLCANSEPRPSQRCPTTRRSPSRSSSTSTSTRRSRR